MSVQRFAVWADGQGSVCEDGEWADADVAQELYEALDEAVKDMICTRNSAWHAAQTDHRWKGVSDILSSRINKCQAALAKARGEQS